MLRVVLDANVVVSAFLQPKGPSGGILRHSLEKKNFEDLLYVGMSRARFGLVVLVDNKVLERLDKLKSY